MIRVVSKGLWREIRALATKGSSKAAAIAYVSSDEISFGEGDVLVTDASNDQIASGQTVAAVLAKALKQGAAVYSLPTLHAKVIVLDRIAVIGSGNMSENSAGGRRIEAAIITDIPNVVSSTRGFIESLTRKKSATQVDERFIRRIFTIKVKKRPRSCIPEHKRTEVKVRESRTWLVSVTPLDEDRYQDERELVEQGMIEAEEQKKNHYSNVTWIRMTGNSRFRKEAQENDSVIQIWTNAKRTRVREVYPHSTILRRQHESCCTRFYVEESRNIAEHTLRWSDFKSLVRSAGLSWEPTKRCARELPEEQSSAIHTMWRKFR